MTEEYRQWEFTEAERRKFEEWVARIDEVHHGTAHARNDKLHWTPLTKPLRECVVGLFTTGGVHLRDDEPFDIASPHGDGSYRRIPADADTANLVITHSHYNHAEADRDINCMLPLDRLRELRDAGVIGGIAPMVYSIMGFNPDPAPLRRRTAPELARLVRESGADLLFMTCG